VRAWVVLPSFNEAANLPALFSRFQKLAAAAGDLDLHVLVVDDGSTDGTARVARDAAGTVPVEVITHDANRGLAETFKRGMIDAASRAKPGDVIVCMDADNSHMPDQIPSMIGEIHAGRDVVIASRYRPGSIVRGVPWPRRILSRGLSVLLSIVLPIEGVRDYSCGYRVYRAEFVQRALTAQGDRLFVNDGFACMLGILLHLARAGGVFGEIPLVLRYDQKLGTSKMKVGTTITRTLALVTRERLRRRNGGIFTRLL